MGSTVNGIALSSAAITMARIGNWSVELSADDETALAGAASLDIDGQAFEGYVTRSGVFAGRVSARVVGGKGGLGKTLPAKSYANGPSVAQILGDILREAGETLSATASPDALAKRFGKWHREKDTAMRAIDTLAEIAALDWRVLGDGTVWFGTDDYAEQKLEHEVVDEDWARGIITIDPVKPELRPGVTFRGMRVEEARHYLTPHGLRTEAAADSLVGHFRRLLADANRRIDYSRKYPARVVSQNGDKTLQVVMDDDRVKSPGLDKVPIRHGFPGSAKVPGGARCLVGFAAGDPSRPYAEGWEGTTFTEIQLGDGTQPAARQGDMVLSGGPTTGVVFAPIAPTPAGPMATGGLYTMLFFPVLNPAGTSPYLAGAVSSGNPKLKE